MVRLRNSYIIAQSIGPSRSPISSRDIQQSLKSSIEALFGSVGIGTFGGSRCSVRFFEQESSIFVVRAPRVALPQVCFALSCILSLKEDDISIRVLGVNSCGRACKRKLKTLVLKAEGADSSQCDAARLIESCEL